MRKITVLSMMTLDGVIQAPGGPEEDPSGLFPYGGWTWPYDDEMGGKVVQEELQQPADYLLGRKTFDIWAAYWPDHADLWPGINEGTKYVLSNTRKTTDWKNTVFVEGVEAIKKIKSSPGRDIQVWGSSQLVPLLLDHDLVDELRLKIYPLTLGGGKKLFSGGTRAAAFSMVKSLTTPSGVIIAHYRRAGEVKTGSLGG